MAESNDEVIKNPLVTIDDPFKVGDIKEKSLEIPLPLAQDQNRQLRNWLQKYANPKKFTQRP